MSGNEGYPPPGPAVPSGPVSPPPGAPLPGWPAAGWAAPPPGWAPPPPGPVPGMLGAAHKPGALPLRPLGIGDMYDAAFRIIRFNPKATVGSAVLVAAVAMAVPVVVTALLSWTVDLSLDASAGSSPGATSPAWSARSAPSPSAASCSRSDSSWSPG